MAFLILGVILFLATHSLRILAPRWRQAQIDRLGEKKWKAILSLAAIVTLVFMIWGFGQARADPILVYQPPLWLKHLAVALTIPAFLLFTAGNVPGNWLKVRVGHPMAAGVKLWAFSHLLANGQAHDLVLFGGLLIWSIVSFTSARRRDRVNGVTPLPATMRGNIIVFVGGLGFWALFAFLLHGLLIGVNPLA